MVQRSRVYLLREEGKAWDIEASCDYARLTRARESLRMRAIICQRIIIEESKQNDTSVAIPLPLDSGGRPDLP